MSLDLFAETDNVLANLRPVADPEPGVWDNFTAGAGKVAMQTFAKAGRAASMAAAPLAMALEKAPGSTEVQDKFFKAHDDIFGHAVDYWTPKPGEVGEAGQVVGQLLGTLPMLFASPALTVAQTQLSVAEDMARKGVDAGTAQAIGATQAAGLGLGIWVPILGKTLAQRVLVGGAGFNVVQGGATRAISAQLAEGTAAEGDFKTFDPTALTLDVLLGAAFGGIAHINPRMRAEGEAWQKRLTEWGAKLKPSEVDALAALRQSQHLNADSMPGKPVDVADTNAHVDRMRQAIDDLANDRPVNVEDMPTPRFEADAVRAEEANAAIRAMQDEARAAGMVLEENALPKVSSSETAPSIDDATGLPLNADGTVTLYHHTSAKKAGQIRKTGKLKADAEPDVYVTTRQETDTGYGDTAVQIRVKPDSLSLDDEFPDGRKDFRLNVGKPGGSVKVAIHDAAAAPRAKAAPEAGKPATEAAEPADPITTAAARFAAENPDMPMFVGKNADGSDITTTPRQWLEDADAAMRQANDDVKLFEIAAGCLLGGGR